jgi:hypothetical protein
MATKTDAYFLSPYRDMNSSLFAGHLTDIAVTNDAKTELIEIKCIDNSLIGSELWNVRGSSTGAMGQARTGLLADFTHVQFSIPQKLPDNWDQVHEDWSHELTYVARDSGVDNPPICFDMQLGINSTPQTLVLEYRRRPPECPCPPVSFSKSCLGLISEEEGGEAGVGYTVPDLNLWTDMRIDKVVETTISALWSEAFERGTASPVGPSSSYPTVLNVLESAIAPYRERFKRVATRIMQLPEDSPALLESLVTNYKAAVESLSVSQAGAYISGQNYLRWIKDITYNTTSWMAVVEDLLSYEKTYGVKKNIVNPGGTCYQDASQEYYWHISGSKAYLPAFTGIPCYSTIKSGDEYVNTKEFAFLIDVPCSGALKEGDKITVTIGGTPANATYEEGDIIYLPTIAAHNLQFAGGIDGDDLYTFEVKGEIDTFPQYLLDSLHQLLLEFHLLLC